MLYAFLSYRYRPDGDALAAKITLFLQSLGVGVRSGKEVAPGGGALPDQIGALIENSHLFVLLLNEGDAGEYLYQELGYARGKNKPVVVITEGKFVGAWMQNEYQIHLSKGEMAAAADLNRAVSEIRVKLRIGATEAYMEHSPLEQIRAEGWAADVLDELLAIRACFNDLEYGQAGARATALHERVPDCWRAGIARSAAHVALEEYDTADTVLDDVIARFGGSGRALSHAYQNKGWILYHRRQRDDEGNSETRVLRCIELYRKSLKYSERVAVYVNLIEDLLRLQRIAEAEAEFQRCLQSSPSALEEARAQAEFLDASTIQELCKSSLIFRLIFPKKGNPNP